jgi:hypothetical protein
MDDQTFFMTKRTIRIPPFMPALLAPVLTEILKTHGVQITLVNNELEIVFPEQTRQLEMLPRVHDTRYQLTLPDGYICYLIHFWTGPTCLSFHLDDLPPDLRQNVQTM